MDAEVFKLKEKKGINDEKPQYMDLERRKDLVYNLNYKFGVIFNDISSGKIDKEGIIIKVAEAIIDILDAFAYMNVCPDYFWRIMMQMNVVLRKVTDNKKKIELTNLEQDIAEAHDRYFYDKIRNGIGKRNTMPIDVNDNYIELLSFYKVFGLTYNNNELLHSKKYLDKFLSKCFAYNIELLNADDIIDDVKCMMGMLFEYMSFFVEVGVNPKKYVDNIMEEYEKQKNQQK